MIKIKIIAMGKLKEKFLIDACNEYKKRLSRFCELEIIELTPSFLSDNPSKSQIESALSKEAEIIIKKIPDNSHIVSLCVEGKSLSSEQFAKAIDIKVNEGKGICFIIGSSYGLSNEIKERADLKLSLSEMTFPHQLFRVMLLEQVYRSFMINEGSAYHK